jgi:hypothetical protein
LTPGIPCRPPVHPGRRPRTWAGRCRRFRRLVESVEAGRLRSEETWWQRKSFLFVSDGMVKKYRVLVPVKPFQRAPCNSAWEQHALKNVNNCLNTNIYSYLETSGGHKSNLHLNVVHFFNTSVNETSVAV